MLFAAGRELGVQSVVLHHILDIAVQAEVDFEVVECSTVLSDIVSCTPVLDLFVGLFLGCDYSVFLFGLGGICGKHKDTALAQF